MTALNESTLTELGVYTGGSILALAVTPSTAALTGLYIEGRLTPYTAWIRITDNPSDYTNGALLLGAVSSDGTNEFSTLAAGSTATLYLDASKYYDVRVLATGTGSAVCSSTPRVGSAVSQGTLRQVATGTFVYDALHASNTFAYGRNPHFIRDDVTELSLVFANWYVNGSYAEANGSGVASWRAAIEYPVGVFTQVTFGGEVTGTVAAGLNLVSDPCKVSIPNGAQFWTRIWNNTTGKIMYFSKYCGDGTAQGGYGTTIGACPDLTMGGTAGSVLGTSGAFAVCPAAILAVSSVPAVCIAGDSISVGTGDVGTLMCRQGYLAVAFGGKYPYLHIGVHGDTLSNFRATRTKRVALSTYCTHIVGQWGSNDVTGSRTAVQILDDLNNIMGSFSGKPFAICTLTPRVSSTDSWVTVANQTVLASEAVRVVVNAQRRNGTGMTYAGTCYDIEKFCESSAASGKWNVIPGTITPATPGFTSDGVHPNHTGVMAIAGSINTSALV